MSPDISDRLERSSPRKPDEMATAVIITKKLTAIHIIAIFPLKRSLDAMKVGAPTDVISSMLQDGLEPEDVRFPNHILPSAQGISSPA